MDKNKLIIILKELSEGFLKNKIDGKVYAKVVESLIVTNLDLVPKLEEFADFLAQYNPKPDMPELYGDKDLVKKIKGLSIIKEK